MEPIRALQIFMISAAFPPATRNVRLTDFSKLQHKMMSTREEWRGRKRDFYKIAHGPLYILRKPAKDEKTTPLKYSKEWW